LSASTKNSSCERGHDGGRLQLESPAELLAARAQRGEHRTQRDECDDDAGRERAAS
jgi:hypothetical protein